jgi:hypothetical protein
VPQPTAYGVHDRMEQQSRGEQREDLTRHVVEPHSRVVASPRAREQLSGGRFVAR